MKSKVILSLTIVALVTAFSPYGERYFEIAKNLDIYTTLFKEVNAYYVDEVDPKKLVEAGIDGMLHQLDPYTDYIPEEELEAFSIQNTGSYAGIGALIGLVNGKSVVTDPYPGFPAHKAGLRVGDELISIDGINVKGKASSETSVLLKGKPKTEVTVEINRPGQEKNIIFKITREKIKVNNISYQGIIQPEVGYIKLDEFLQGAGKEFEEAVRKLKHQGAKKLILDLRDNPGGSLYEAVNIANAFLPKAKEIVSTKGKVPEWNKSYSTLNNPVDLEMPLVVLTSSSSASASEIVAGSLQDYDRAVLIGQKTFGKGLVQTTRQLAYNTQLKVTTAKYHIPSGRCIQALDYTNRTSDGTVNRVADSLKSEFKTRNGRTVYDGGGLDPDILVTGQEYSAIVRQLAASSLFFEYANIYCANKPVPVSMKSFRLSDEQYNDFVKWIKRTPFTYTSELESQAEKLIASAKNEKFYSELQGPLRDLQSKIQASRQNDLMRYKPEITRILEEEIAYHFQLHQGQIDVSVDRDSELQEALKLLSDPERYNKILSPK